MAGHDPSAPIVTLNGETMGTSWRVHYAAPRDRPEGAVRVAINARLDGLVAQMSHWDTRSTLSAFNRAAAGSWIALPSDFSQVIDAPLRIAHASDGAFDPAIGRLVDLWGFGPAGAKPAPDRAAIADACKAGGWRRLRWDAERRRLYQPGGVALDLSGIAKGYAADALADGLATMGVRHCLVEVGGELVGRGLRPDGDPWWVDLETPPGAALPPLRAALHQQAVATSGSYVRGEHSIDPRSGYPARNGVVSVSMIARSAMLADALATAAAVLFPDLEPLGRFECAARIVHLADGAPHEVITPALRAMLDDP